MRGSIFVVEVFIFVNFLEKEMSRGWCRGAVVWRGCMGTGAREGYQGVKVDAVLIEPTP